VAADPLITARHTLVYVPRLLCHVKGQTKQPQKLHGCLILDNIQNSSQFTVVATIVVRQVALNQTPLTLSFCLGCCIRLCAMKESKCDSMRHVIKKFEDKINQSKQNIIVVIMKNNSVLSSIINVTKDSILRVPRLWLWLCW
jgi:flagellar motor switch/type III secretory pathway protein FliN